MTVALSFVGTLEAQGFRVQGSVVRMDATDSLPVAGVWASLHEITALGGQVVDSQRTRVSGMFTIASPRGDTLASYLISVEHHGIAYFSEPFRNDDVPSPTLLVYDTSSVANLVTFGERHVIIQGLEDDGTRRVIELFVLRNESTSTRVAPDTSNPVWQTALPAGVLDFEVGSADVSADAIYLRGDTVAIAAPIPPGERQILVTYLIPRNTKEVSVPLDQPIRHLNVLVSDSSATVGPAVLQFRGWETIEAVPYQRYGVEDLLAGGALVVTVSDLPLSSDLVLWVMIPLVALAMFTTAMLWRRRGASVPAPVADDPEALGAQIAALDRAKDSMDPEAYAAERAALKQRLVDMLANQRSGM